MFTPAVARAVRSPSGLPVPAACAFARPAAVGASQKPFARHQRRMSSSKTSMPPDGSNANGSNANGSNSAQQTPANASKEPTKKESAKAAKKRASNPPAPALNVPHVPPTDYLQKPDVKVSSFFSLHRPISLDNPVPPVATQNSFDSIFAPRSPYSRKSTLENMQTLSNGVQSLEAALSIHEKRAPEIALQEAPPQATLKQLMDQFLPFRPPPPPVPFGEASEEAVNNMVEDVAATAAPKQRVWSTSVVVTESTDASGKRTYSATTAPMVEISEPATDSAQEPEYDVNQPFLDRMRQRQSTNNRSREGRPDMLAISVKRQRKLKMKKHKYKKLMKRTRLERRKLDRA